MASFTLFLLVSALLLRTASSLCRFDVPSNATELHPFSAMLAATRETGDPKPAELRNVCYNESQAVCWCSADELDCSGNDGNLSFVPKVNGTFDFLNFTYNYLEEIGEDFFLNVTEVSRLDLGDNHYLARIHPQAFSPLSDLREVYLDYDYSLTHNYTLLAPVLSVGTLTRLDIRVGDLPPMPHDLFHRHPLPFLETLYLHYNSIEYLNMSILTPLANLTTLGVASNKLTYVHWGYAPSLQKLNLNYNNLLYFPHTCAGRGRSYYPRLQQLMLKDNKIKAISKTVCLPSLTYLDLGQNKIKTLATGTFRAQGRFPSLRELYLENMELMKVEDGAFDNPVLQTLSLMYNHFYFSVPGNVTGRSFHNCTGLQNLLLGQNYITNDNFIRIFGHLRNLSYIHLGNNNIRAISWQTFSGFPRLTTLCLYQNGLTTLPDGAFDSLQNLTTLEIDYNQIQTVQPEAFSPETRSRFGHVDLSQNPFRCDCDIRWFQSWLRSDAHKFNNSRGNYECYNIKKKSSSPFLSLQQQNTTTSSKKSSPFSIPLLFSSLSPASEGRRNPPKSRFSSLDQRKGSNVVVSSASDGAETWDSGSEVNSEPKYLALVEFSIPQQTCMLDRETNIFIVIVVSLLMITVSLISTVYHYRWHIRLLVHETFRGRGEGYRRRQRVQNFCFDVYVAFADEDWTWVKHVLMPELENKLGLRLYIRKRDAVPGRYIADNIVENILSSRKVLMVFSRSFANRKWCQFELSFGLQHVIRTDDELVVLRLHEIPSEELTTPMWAVFQILNYIPWSTEKEARASFWGRLSVSLQELFPVCP